MAQPPYTLASPDGTAVLMGSASSPECGQSIGGKGTSNLEKTTSIPCLVPRSIKQVDQLLVKSPDIDSADVAEEWNPPIPEYPFVERARIADAFFGPDAESIDGEGTLARRIQVVGDLAALCKLRQPSRRGKPFNWNKEKTANDAILQREDEDIKTRKTSPPTSPVSPRPSADQCPFCFFEEGLFTGGPHAAVCANRLAPAPRAPSPPESGIPP